MSKLPTRKIGPLVTGAEIRLQLGVSERAVSRWYASGLRVAKRDEAGKNPRVRIWDLVRWLHDKDAGIDDPDLGSGGTSKALEKYRAEKARQAKRENDLAEGRIVEREAMFAVADEIGRALATELEALDRVHGAVVGAALREAVVRQMQAWQGRLEGVGEAKKQ